MARHALLIGVSTFEDQRLSKLNAPTADVEALGTVLLDTGRGAFTSVEVSIDKDYLTVRDQVAALFERRDPEDLLLLYYSGHGIQDRRNRLYLATPGSDYDRPQARSLSTVELRELMDNTRAEQQVLVLDCCHSGAFAEGAKGVAAPAVTEETFGATAPGRYILAASTAQQFAYDGGSLRQGSQADRKLSRFTSWLVDGLNGQASPDDEEITMDAVFRYVSKRAKAEGSPATPQLQVDRRTGELVIARNPAAGSAWQDRVGKLNSDDWKVRLAAAEELGVLSRKTGAMADRARKALEDRFDEEEHWRVRPALSRVLGLDQERPPEPEAAPEVKAPPEVKAAPDVKAGAEVKAAPDVKAASDVKAEPPQPPIPPDLTDVPPLWRLLLRLQPAQARLDLMSARLAANWWAVALRGVVAVLFGALFWGGDPELLFAAYLLVDGAFTLIAAIRATSHHERWGPWLFDGILNLVTGVIVAADILDWIMLPDLAELWTACAWALLNGGCLVAAAFRLHVSHGRSWLLLGGVVSLVWGVMFVIVSVMIARYEMWHWLPEWLGAYAIAFGVAMLVLAFRLRSRWQDQQSAGHAAGQEPGHV